MIHTPVRYRVGFHDCISTMPLTTGLKRHGQCEPVSAEPTELSRLLQSGALDAALLPLDELLSLSESVHLLRSGCAAWVGACPALRVAGASPLDEIEILLARPRDRTGAILVQLLWLSEFGAVLRIRPREHAELHPDDRATAVILNEEEVELGAAGWKYQQDITELWHESTGLPLPIWLWTCSVDHAIEPLHEMLTDVRIEACRHLPEIASCAAALLGCSRTHAERILDSLRFELDEDVLDGLDEWLSLAAEEGLSPHSRRVWTLYPVRPAPASKRLE